MAIGWSETAPSDSSAANLADDELRSLKSNLAGGLANAVYWPGTGGSSLASAGQPLPGAWRAYYGAQSLVSAYADGAMYVTSDTSRLFGVGSGGTMLLGSARVVENAVWPGTKARWVQAEGTFSGTGSAGFGVTYDVAPVVTIGVFSASTTVIPVITSLSVGTVGVTGYRLDGGAASGFTIHWRSLGTVTF